MILLAFTVTTASASDFGTTGLITAPSARQMPDGHLAARVEQPCCKHLQHHLPSYARLETTFRYSVFNPYGREESADGLRDRSYEAKVRLVRESDFFPELAVGIRDILGTGVWSGEYLVGTKHIGPAEISLGLGWGRFAERDEFNNPLGIIDGRFENRPGDRDTGGALGGEVRGAVFFVEMSVFSEASVWALSPVDVVDGA